MKKAIIIFIFIFLVAAHCKQTGIIVGKDFECDYNEIRFEKIFTSCVGRVSLSSGDPDDFVSECRGTAEKHAKRLCFWYCYDYDASYPVYNISKIHCNISPRDCANAEIKKEKDACWWFGYRGEK